MTKTTRNPQETQKRILTAALEEFSEHGFHGARVERIVKAAEVNKRMVYHYFNDKEGLFKALMQRELQKIKQVEQSEPTDSLLNMSQHWLDSADQTKDYFRLALSAEQLISSGELTLDEEHEDSFSHSMKVYNRLLEGKDVDPRYFLLAMVSLTALPVVLPKMADYITGESQGSDKFNAEYQKVLKVLLDRL